jgi:hypothetical protein
LVIIFLATVVCDPETKIVARALQLIFGSRSAAKAGSI